MSESAVVSAVTRIISQKEIPMTHKTATIDPMEQIISQALMREGFKYHRENHKESMGLDFYLPDYDIHIEVKQFHSDRISKQMARAKNVIALQGRDAVEMFAALLCDYNACDKPPHRPVTVNV